VRAARTARQSQQCCSAYTRGKASLCSLCSHFCIPVFPALCIPCTSYILAHTLCLLTFSHTLHPLTPRYPHSCLTDRVFLLCPECDTVFHKAQAKRCHLRVPVLQSDFRPPALSPSPSPSLSRSRSASFSGDSSSVSPLLSRESSGVHLDRAGDRDRERDRNRDRERNRDTGYTFSGAGTGRGMNPGLHIHSHTHATTHTPGRTGAVALLLLDLPEGYRRSFHRFRLLGVGRGARLDGGCVGMGVSDGDVEGGRGDGEGDVDGSFVPPLSMPKSSPTSTPMHPLLREGLECLLLGALRGILDDRKVPSAFSS
jgi:hypothetical protein